jgi:tetratricopeptide (TPR) repeat protein
MMIRRVPWLQRSFPAVLSCALFAAPLQAADKPARWIRVSSDHFSVLTDAGDKKGREVAVRLEQMRAAFGQLLMRSKLKMPEPLEVIALKDNNEYGQVAPLKGGRPIARPGFFVPGEDRNYVVLNLFEEESWRAVNHEFAHLLLKYNYPTVAPWFDEGFAEYYSSVRVDDKRMEIGLDPELGLAWHSDRVGNQVQVGDPPRALTELLGPSVWLALPDLFSMSPTMEDFHEATHHTLFYAQSWMTLHYLLNKHQLQQTGVYFDLVENQHLPLDQAMARAFGMTVAQFDQAVKDYFHSLGPLFATLDASKQSTATTPGGQLYFTAAPIPGDEIGTSTRELPYAEGQASLAEMTIRIAEHRDQAIGQLQALLADPKTESAVAYRALAWDHMRRREPAEAIEELKKALQIDSKDPWSRYELALQTYRTAQLDMHSFPGLANMMQDLQTVIDWYPDFAEAYNMLAVGRLRGGGAHSAMTAIKVAVQLSPRNESYLLNMANIEIALKQWAPATALLERLSASRNPQIAHLAKKDLIDLPTLKKYGIVPQEESSPGTTTPGSDRHDGASPPSPTEEDSEQANATASPPAPVPDRRPLKFLKGNLVRVDCQSPAAVLSILSGGKMVKLRTENTKSLVMLGSEQFSCEWKHRQVSVNYKPGGKSDGDLISLEVQ